MNSMDEIDLGNNLESSYLRDTLLQKNYDKIAKTIRKYFQAE